MQVSDPLLPSGQAEYAWVWDTLIDGKLSASTDPTGSTSYEYDHLARQEAAERTWDSGPGTWRSETTWDLQDRPVSRSFPEGTQLTYKYNRGRLASITDENGDKITIDYHETGLDAGWHASNGHELSIGYDETVLWPISYSFSAGPTKAERIYENHDNGFPESVFDGRHHRDYRYDRCKRLTDVRKGTTPEETFRYDANGSFLEVWNAGGTEWGYQYAPANHAKGAQVAWREAPGRGREDFGWDAVGRLASVRTANHTVGYAYDWLSRLRAVTLNGQTIETIDRDGAGTIVRRSDGDPALPATGSTYIFGGTRFDEFKQVTTHELSFQLARENGANRWLFRDRVQHVPLVVDDAGQVSGETRLSAYGAPLQSSGQPWDLASLHGQEREPRTGLLAIGPRHLRPDGMWLQPEPALHAQPGPLVAKDPQRLIPYVFAASNPQAYHDPSGELPHLLAVAYVGAEVGATLLDFQESYEATKAVVSEPSVQTGLAFTATVGLTAAGIVLPTGGWTKADDAAEFVAKRVCSFDGSTLVLTEKGFVAIRDIIPGHHHVWSRDKQSGEMAFKPVINRYSNVYDDVVHVTVLDLESGASQTIRSNRVHSFFVVSDAEHGLLVASQTAETEHAPSQGEWVQAQDLRTGHRLFNSDRGWSRVVSIRIEATPFAAYNLNVADFHTYFVKGSASTDVDAVWVDNCWKKRYEEAMQQMKNMKSVLGDKFADLDVKSHKSWYTWFKSQSFDDKEYIREIHRLYREAHKIATREYERALAEGLEGWQELEKPEHFFRWLMDIYYHQK